jgi:hypothetical protein
MSFQCMLWRVCRVASSESRVKRTFRLPKNQKTVRCAEFVNFVQRNDASSNLQIKIKTIRLVFFPLNLLLQANCALLLASLYAPLASQSDYL